MKKSIVILACIGLGALGASAKVELPAFMTDSMVVQRCAVLPVEGKAKGRVTVAPSWTDSVYTTRAPKGRFSVDVPTPDAGGPWTIRIADADSEVTLRDVYSGLVWLCSGQSNMEMPVGGWGQVNNKDEELATSVNYPKVRLLQIARRPSALPTDDAKVTMGGWHSPSPETVENFSAVAFFFAKDLQKALGDIPVGVIDCSWGGTYAESWSSLEGITEVGGFEDRVKLYADRKAIDRAVKNQAKAQAEWEAQTYRIDNPIDPAVYHAELPTMDVPGVWTADNLGNFDGTVWMQREVDIPAAMAGKPLILNIPSVDDDDVTYFNGVKVGETAGYNLTRSYTVPAELVRQGKNVITVLVFDYRDKGGIWGDPDMLFVEADGKRLSLAGPWAYAVATDRTGSPDRPVEAFDAYKPLTLYNGMLYPMRHLPFEGVIWYQGCSNVGRAEQYSRLFPRMIADWRRLFDHADMPFYFVQLAGFLKPQEVQPDSEWAALRQAQTAALALPNTAMATAIDIGNPDDIHPKNKQEVARRLSLLALNRTYGLTDIIDHAPAPLPAKLGTEKVTLAFDAPVCAPAQQTEGFIVRTAGGWLKPEASVNADGTVTLTAPAPILEVRYDWADYPYGTLRGTTSLPVTPFVLK